MSGMHSLAAFRPKAAQTHPSSTAPGAEAALVPGLVLSAWLEALGQLQPGSLHQVWMKEGGDLAACLARHFPSAKTSLEIRLGVAGWQEIVALSKESEAEFFTESWLRFAQRQMKAGHLDIAASVFGSLASGQGQNAELATRELNAILGKGSGGARFEFLLGEFAAQASDPAMLGGMAVASLAFQGTKLLSLSRLLSRPGANALTRGFGARALASSLGFSAEVPAFLLASKGIHQILGRNQDWSPKALGHEGLSLGITLLFLKGFGSLGRQAMQGLPMSPGGVLTPASWLKAANLALPQAASFAGIYLGHRAESALGLKPKLDEATTLMDSLVFLLQFHVGGQLSRTVMGADFAASIQRMEWLSENIQARPDGKNGTLFPGTPLVALASGRPLVGMREIFSQPPRNVKYLKPEPLFMAQIGSGEDSSYKFLERRLLDHYKQTLTPGPEASEALRERFSRMVEDIGETYLKTKNVDLQRYFKLLHESRLHDVPHEDGRVTTRIEQLSVAVKCFCYAMEMNPLRRAVGSHYDYLLQEAFERTLKEGTAGDFEALVRVASISRRIESIETFLKERDWAARYEFLPLRPPAAEPPPTLWGRLQKNLAKYFRPPSEPPPTPEWLTRLRSLALSEESRIAVERYLVSYTDNPKAAGFRDPANNYILWRPSPKDERREAFTPELAIQGLAEYLQKWKPHPAYRRVLEDAIHRAAGSEMPLLHFDRIFKVLATHDLPHKIAEVASSEEFHWGRLQGYLDLSMEESGFEATAGRISGTIFTGYIYDRILAEKFSLLYLNSDVFLREHEEEIRLGQFHSTVDYLYKDIKNYGRDDVMNLLKMDQSPDASLAIQALEGGRADIKMVSRDELRQMWRQLPSHRRVGNHPRVVFIPGEKGAKRRGTVVVAKKETFDEADVLYMLRLRATPVADKARAAIMKGEIDLQVLPKEELKAFFHRLDPASKDEDPPRAFYVPANKSPHKRPIIVVESLDPNLEWKDTIWQAIFLPAQTVHEFEHHLHHGELANDVFLSEMRAWIEEIYFLMYNGDLRTWREMQETSPYGFGVYLRNLVDRTYFDGPRDISRKK